MGGRRAWALTLGACAATPPLVVAASMLRVHLIARRARGRTDAAGGTAVVFGSRAFDDVPGPILRARLDHAIELYRLGRVDFLAVAGGVPVTAEGPSGGHDEVPVMASYARAHGVPSDRIVEVRPGQNTREQVASTRRLVVDAGLGPVVAVSSSYHLARIRAESARLGFAVEVAAPVTSPDVARVRVYLAHVLADALAGLFYALPPAVARRVNTSAGSFRHLGVLALTGDVPWREAVRPLRPSSGEGINDGATYATHRH